MKNIDKRIIDFIEKHHVLTLATSYNNSPYCANCFYAYSKIENKFIFSTDLETKHAKDALGNNKIAGSIVLETRIPGKIRGLQFCGEMYIPADKELEDSLKKYYSAFPYARLMKPFIWNIKPTFFKLTDNRLGFGKKIIWGELT